MLPGLIAAVWGVDDASTTSAPSPTTLTTGSSTPEFYSSQMFCDAVNDGICATNNILVYLNAYSATNYAAALCSQPLTGSSATPCTGGSNCYTDWYLPSVCDLGPFGSGGNYPTGNGSQSCASGSTNIENQLVSNTSVTPSSLFPPSSSVFYWSATQYSYVGSEAWTQGFSSVSGGSYQTQMSTNEYSILNALCVRNLTK